MCTQNEYDFEKHLRASYDISDEESQHRTNEIVILLKSGRRNWNDWARKFESHIKEKNSDIINHTIQICDTSFSHSDFQGYYFPMPFIFCRCSFLEGGFFPNCSFRNNITFMNCYFLKNTSFERSKFHKNACFISSFFINEDIDEDTSKIIIGEENQHMNFNCVYNATFDDAKFYKMVDFSNCRFETKASFNRVNFSLNSGSLTKLEAINSRDILNTPHDSIKFNKAKFRENASFIGSFFWSTTYFNESIFNKNAIFKSATFSGLTSYELIEARNLILDRTEFIRRIPNLKYATLKNPPFLSTIKLPDEIIHNQSKSTKLNNIIEEYQQLIEEYQQLRRFAISSSNHKKELELFAQELDIEREKTKLERTPNKEQYQDSLEIIWEWLKLLPYFIYKHLSNYGQSISKPFFWIIFLWAFLTGLTYYTFPGPPYYINSITSAEIANELHLNRSYDCKGVKNQKGLVYSSIYSAQALSPFQLGTDSEREKVAFCLFGDEVPSGPRKLMAVIIKTFGIILFFLIGLGIRNRFKIK